MNHPQSRAPYYVQTYCPRNKKWTNRNWFSIERHAIRDYLSYVQLTNGRISVRVKDNLFDMVIAQSRGRMPRKGFRLNALRASFDR